MININYFVILLLTFLSICISPVYAVQNAQIEYTVPIDYSHINEQVLNSEAEKFFNEYLKTTNSEEKHSLLDKMLSDYSILSNINKDNPLYFIRLGIIYDKMGKDRYAKSNFCRGANLVPDYPYAFYSYGNFFFDRAEYKKALREYMRAYNCGYSSHYYNLYQIAVIYEKFGDYSNAILYYRMALKHKYSQELVEKINLLNELLSADSLYNQNRGGIK